MAAASAAPATNRPLPSLQTDLNCSLNGDAKLKQYSNLPPMNSYPLYNGHTISNVSQNRKQESLAASIRSGIVNHQLGISINFILLVTLAHTCFPRIRQITEAFFQLSYYDPTSGKYYQGGKDFCFVLSWIFIFTGLRATALDYVFQPLAKMWGIKRPKTRVRFAEQSWGLVYATCSWSYGMYLMKHSAYWFNLYEMWTHFPTLSLDGMMKFYYLVQLAFWSQQIVVVNIEERRKDYNQMLTHHIITSTLIFASYTYYQTKVGNVILCAMDVADILLPFAKLLKYLGFQMACDFAFAAFITAWIVSRHICYTMICWSLYFDMRASTPFACFDAVTGEQVSGTENSAFLSNIFHPYLNPDGPVCFNPQIQLSFLGLLTFLHLILLAWLVTILGIAWKVIRGQGADDQRSDASDDDVANLEDLKDEELSPSYGATQPVEEFLELEMVPLEEEVGVESLSFRNRAGNARFRKSGSSTGALAEKKELLGRIGCDKPID